MKKRILTLGAVLALVMALVVPSTVLATTTDVTGNVKSGYTFTPPSAISLGDMVPKPEPYTASSTDGSLTGNNQYGYKVTSKDTKTENTGFMVSGTNVLSTKLQISNENTNYVNADIEKTFLDTAGPTDTTFSLWVSQLVKGTDTVADNYTITITFTVTVKTA